MKKQKEYRDTRFAAEVLKEAIAQIKEVAGRAKVELTQSDFKVDHDDSTWQYDAFEEFLADFRKYKGYAYCTVYGGAFDLTVTFDRRTVSVSVKAPQRADIEAVFDVFEKSASGARLEPPPAPPPKKPVVFVGHGRSPAWRDLKDHMQDKHGIEIEAYETGARAGHTIRDILEDMASKSSFAVLVLTGEDEQADGNLRSRQNVIHEAGLFQGRLGFARAILLLEDGVEEFSNVQGVQYIRFGRGNIRETFGEVLATLRREFPI
ncbi:MAG: nucleotide-binding protein [Rhodocyclaceae bacterium]|nr:nucleotide-binding protein [Rhodocyclaceae bacterium]